MGGLFNFVGALLNFFFSDDRYRVRTTIWDSESMLTDDTVAARATLMTAAVIPPGSLTPQPPLPERTHNEIATLQQIDPDFNELQFLAQAGTAYNAYMTAEGAMNPDALTGIASPNFVATFKKRVDDWNGSGLRRVDRDVKISGSTIIRVAIDGVSQAIIVRFTGTGVRCSQDVATGTAVDGSLQSGSFIEFATFVRPAGTTTPKSAGAGGATHCPSCGAPAPAGAAACPFCGTQLTATGGTWLLDKTSASAYT